MYYMRQNNILGLLFIILGLVLLIIVVGNLLARLLMVIVALGLINYGLQMRGMPPLPVLIRAWLTLAGWRNF